MSLHPQRNLFKEYPNRIFVETGSYRGDGIEAAIDAGFEKIISIDIDREQIEFCHSRFDLDNNPDSNIVLYHADSAECLLHIIGCINEPITFWLDSHWQMLEETDPGKNPFPLLKELEQIKRHPVKTHTIIIDDMLIMQPAIVGYSNEDIKRAIQEINPLYQFTYYANPVINGILVAHI